jgi:hypothetical protein
MERQVKERGVKVNVFKFKASRQMKWQVNYRK